MDMGSIAAAFGSLKALTEISKGLMSLHTMAEVQSVAIELNQKIIEIQQNLASVNQAQSALVEEKRELEKKIAAMETWKAEKQRYKLASPNRGSMVYALKRDMSEGETPHYLCTNCFKKGEPSILQIGSNKDGWTFWGCPICKSQAMTGYRGPEKANYAEDIPDPQ